MIGGFESQLGLGIFLISTSSRPALGRFPGGWSGQGVKLTSHLHLVPRSEYVELFLHSPYDFMVRCLIKQGIRLYGAGLRDNFTFVPYTEWCLSWFLLTFQAQSPRLLKHVTVSSRHIFPVHCTMNLFSSHTTVMTCVEYREIGCVLSDLPAKNYLDQCLLRV